MLQLFLAVAFSAAPLMLYLPPVRSLSLLVEALEAFLQQAELHTAQLSSSLRHGFSRIMAPWIGARR